MAFLAGELQVSTRFCGAVRGTLSCALGHVDRTPFGAALAHIWLTEPPRHELKSGGSAFADEIRPWPYRKAAARLYALPHLDGPQAVSGGGDWAGGLGYSSMIAVVVGFTISLGNVPAFLKGSETICI